MLVIVFIQLAKSLLTLYIKEKRRPQPYSCPGLAQPYTPYEEAYARWRTLQWCIICSLFPLSRCQFGQELSILSVGPSHKLGDKCDRLHICSRKTHIDCKFRHYFRIHQNFIRIYFVLRLKILNLPIKGPTETLMCSSSGYNTRNYSHLFLFLLNISYICTAISLQTLITKNK